MADMKVKMIGVFKDNISKGLKSVGSSLKKIGDVAKKVVAGVTAVVGSLVGITKVATASAKEIQNLARVSDTSVENFQKMAYGANQFGISQEKLADQLKDVNDRIGDFAATGGGAMVDFFENIAPLVGVTAKSFEGLSGPQSLQLYYNSLEKANLSQADMTFYLETMASDLTNLQPLLKNNGELLKQNAKEAEDLGLILSEVDIAQLAEGDKIFQRIAAQAKVTAQLIGLALIPYIAELVNMFNDASSEAGGFGTVIGKVVNFSIRAFGKFADVLRGIHVVFKGLQLILLSFGVAVFSVIEGITHVLAKSVDGWIMMINQAITGLNALGADIEPIKLATDSQFMKDIHRDGDALRNEVTELRSELNDLAMKPMPSSGVETFLANVKKRSEDAAKAAVDLTKNIKAVGDAGAGAAARKTAEARKQAAEDKKKADEKAAKDAAAIQDELLREQARKIQAHYDNFSSVFSSFFSDIANDSKNAFDNLLDNFKNMITSMVAEALASKVMNALFGQVSEGGVGGSVGAQGGALSGFFNSIFGRETGGPVAAGQAYVVGERRPELFVPRQDGTIIPNMAMAGGGSSSITINAIDSRGVADFIETNKFALTSAVNNTAQRYNM